MRLLGVRHPIWKVIGKVQLVMLDFLQTDTEFMAMCGNPNPVQLYRMAHEAVARQIAGRK